MHGRTAALLGLALLVALAGCASLGLGDSDGFADVDYPTGTSQEGITNASALLATHQDHLATDSYRIAFNASATTPDSSGNSTTIVASNPDEERQLQTWNLPGRSQAAFRSADLIATRLSASGQTVYDSQQRNGSFQQVHRFGAEPGPLLETIVRAGDYTANRTDTGDGQTTITFRSTSPKANASGQVPAEIQQFDATLEVAENGHVVRGELFATGTTNGTQQIYYQEYRTLDTGGVTVPRPDWIDRATE